MTSYYGDHDAAQQRDLDREAAAAEDFGFDLAPEAVTFPVEPTDEVVGTHVGGGENGYLTRKRVIRVDDPDPDPNQLTLDGAKPAHTATIDERFQAFHAANPHVYDELVRLARRAKRAGATKIGIGMLFEVLRWRRTMATGGDDFKLNNVLRSRYARTIMECEHDLAGIFETRELHAP